MAYTLQEALLLLQHDLSLDGGWKRPPIHLGSQDIWLAC